MPKTTNYRIKFERIIQSPLDSKEKKDEEYISNSAKNREDSDDLKPLK